MDGTGSGGEASPSGRYRPDEQESARLVGAVVDQISDHGILLLDPQGVIVTWNLGAQNLKGYTPGQAIGQHFAMFYGPEDRRDGLPMRLLDEARTNGNTRHRGWRLRRDGTRFWGDVSITALHDGEGQLTGFAKVTRDLTEEHEARQALVRSEERFRLLVSEIRDYAMISLDPQGIVELWNPGAEAMKGYTAEDVVGQHFSVFYPPQDRAEGLPLRLLDEARAVGHVRHAGWRVRRDGTRFWGDVLLTALRDATGELRGFSKITRDMTEVHELELERERFLAAVAHDIKAPLTSIRGFVELLDEHEGETRELMVQRLYGAVDRLARLVSDVVAHSEGRALAREASIEPVDLAATVARMVGELGGLLAEHDVRLDPSLDGLVVAADQAAFDRVVQNLVGNAAKYSAPGTTVTIAARPDGEVVHLDVADQGRGIEEADLGTIFDEFERGRLSERDGGTGLGLATVRHLVRAMQGEVAVASEVGAGSTFTVSLPALQRSRERAPR